MSKKTMKKPISKTIKPSDLWTTIPIFFIIGFVPLIIYVKPILLSNIETIFTGGAKSVFDIFSYYKMVFLLTFTVIGLLAVLFKRGSDMFEKDRRLYYYLLAIYALLVLLSSLTAEYKEVAFRGYYDRFEGAFVLIAYVTVLFLAMTVFKDEKHINILFLFLFLSSFVISILGVLQLLGFDYIKTNLVKELITPSSLKKLGGSFQLTQAPRTIFSTLYNPNYVGSYMAMVLPVIITFLLYVKKIVYKLLLSVLLIPVLINWIWCDSRAGMIGGAVAVAIILIMSWRKILKHKIISVSILVLLCAVGIITNHVTHGSIVISFNNIIHPDINANQNRLALEKSIKGLQDFLVDNNRIQIVTEKGTLQITLADNGLSFDDGNNNAINQTITDNIIRFQDKRFDMIHLNIKPEEGRLDVFYNDYDFIDLLITKDGFRSNKNIWLAERNNRKIDSFGFEGMETFASGRGYIWSRTIPLIKNTVLLGHGPDTFPFYFPQYDYIGKLKMADGAIFVDKAHSIYLQTALNTGVLSLLAIVTLFALYFASSIKIYIKEEHNSIFSVAGLACFAAFCSYIVVGIFNDSVISVAPVFWVLLGLGIGMNFFLKEKSRKNSIKV